jgi:peroxiredoxin
MKLLKSLFISGFMAYLVSVLVNGAMQLVSGAEPALSWLGLMLTGLGPLAFFGWIYVKRPARTERHPVPYSIIGGLGLAITLAMSWKHGDAAGMIHAWSGLAIIGWFVYLRWYSPMGNGRPPALSPGATLPRFELQDLDGRPVNSESFRGNPHLLVFYRGNWCPFCTAQIRELAEQYRQIEALGASVVLISPQSQEKNRAIAGRFDVPMRFLRDRENAAAKQLGIIDAWGVPMGMQMMGYDSDTVRPAVIVSDAEGRILYAHLADNYRVRPEPSEILEVLGS